MTRLVVPAAAAVFIGLSVLAYGDIARPKPSPIPAGKAVLYTGLTIQPDTQASEARLLISRDTLKNINHALANQSGKASVIEEVTHSSTRTILAGLFLCLSLSFAGVWLVRSSQGRLQKTVTGILVIAAVLGAATVITQANAGPPGYIRWAGLTKSFDDGKPTTGGVSIEIVSDDSNMTLLIPVRPKPANGE